jgi:hypothetical protein
VMTMTPDEYLHDDDSVCAIYAGQSAMVSASVLAN